jgi:hypothetical protein
LRHRISGFLTLLSLWALVFGLTLLRVAPPRPVPADAPLDVFSAGRAVLLLQGLLKEGVPHPVGSFANARVRDRILVDWRAAGYRPEVQEGFACDRFGVCGKVENVVARLLGRSPGKAVLLMAHYDSVAAGPGASDDGVGAAAVLEVARALKAGPPLSRTVIFLIDDGEEAGLLGAAAFWAESPWRKDVGAIVNLEARGTSGPSLMFETSGENGWLATALAGHVSRPITSSVFSTIYDQLPNDTDLTIFKEDRVPGLNFAFIGDVSHYHTPLDDLDHVALGSLQHHGDNALAMVKALSAANLEEPPAGSDVFFDVLGCGVARWGIAATLPAAALAFLLLLVVAQRLWAGGSLDLTRLLFGLAAASLALVLALALGGALAQALRVVGSAPRAFVAHPGPAILGFWSAGLLGAALAGVAFGQKAGASGLWVATWLPWAGLALATARWMPGMSYLFLVPALAAALSGLFWVARPQVAAGASLAMLLPSLTAAVLFVPLAWFLYDAMGIPLMPLVTVLVGVVAFTGAPLACQRPGRLVWVVPLVGLLAGFSDATLVSTATRERPERMVLSFHQDADSGLSRWLVSDESKRLPEAMRRVATFTKDAEQSFPWPSPSAFVATVAASPLSPPELVVLGRSASGGERRIDARIVSRRGASDVALAFPPGASVRGVEIGGKPARSGGAKPQAPVSGWEVYEDLTTSPEGVTVTITLSGDTPVSVILMDRTPGLPAAGATLLIARPRWAVTSGEGDLTVVTRRVAL